jgi:hypothetical protein
MEGVYSRKRQIFKQRPHKCLVDTRTHNLGLPLTLLKLEFRAFQIHFYSVISVQFSIINKNGDAHGLFSNMMDTSLVESYI